jgi:hypothetical protein
MVSSKNKNALPSSQQLITLESSTTLVSQYTQQVNIERRREKGNCLVANTLIKRGERIRDTHNQNDAWEPLVPPVLHESCRSTHCALCFQKVGITFYRFEETKPRHEYLMLFCSTSCRDAARNKSMTLEEFAICRIYEQGGPPKIFSTAILLYRMIYWTQMQHDGTWKRTKDELDKLQYEISDLTLLSSIDTSVSDCHTQAVITTTATMIKVSTLEGLSLPTLDKMTALVNRIKLNGFSICDGESVAMGVGLFGVPSFMNNSCKPNAVQTFLYGCCGKVPSLFVTAFHDIAPNQEVCISYVDNSSPRTLRRERLQSDYFFNCKCELCVDDEYDSGVIGIKCRECQHYKPTILVKSYAPSPQAYECQNCGNTNFQKTLDYMEAFDSVSSLKELFNMYNNLKQGCWRESWYVQECGDRLVQSLLDLLGEQSDNIPYQQQSASKAFEVLDELLSYDIDSSLTSNYFRQNIRLYKAAKLRLFLLPDPRKSIHELETVRTSLSPYYPQDHELMVSLRKCLQGAMG